MACELILHIGYPKTGTTSLQHFLQANEKYVGSHGLLYPKTGRIHGAHYGFSYRFGQMDSVELSEFPPLEGLLASLNDEIESSGQRRVLLSSEYFIKAVNLEPVRAALRGYDVKIMIYLRRHDHIFESGYGQSIRGSSLPPWDSSIASYILHQTGAGQFSYDYLGVLRRWAAVFGKENLIVRAFQENWGDSLYLDMLDAIGLPSDPALHFPAQSNPSLDYGTVAAIDAVQRSSVSVPFKNAIVARLIKAEPAAERHERSKILSPSDRLSVVARYQHMYAAIGREFLGRKDGVLFNEPAPRPDPAWRPPIEPGRLELAEMLLKAAELTARASKEGGA